MRAIVLTVTAFLISGFLFSCGGGDSTTDEPVYEIDTGETVEIDPGEIEDTSYEVNLDILRGAVEAEPDSPDAHFIYMTGLIRAGEFTDALEECRIIGQLGGENPFRSVAYLNFGNIVLKDIAIDDPNREELVTEGIDLLWVALGIEPESIPAHEVLGLLSMEVGDDDKALHHLSISLSATEIGYEPRTRMAKIYIGREDYYKAREHLEVALVLAEEASDAAAVTEIHRLLGQIN